MDDHLSHGPTKAVVPCYRDCVLPAHKAPTWTCTVAEIARATPPSPGDLRLSSSLRVHVSQGEHFPHRRLTPPDLTARANFLSGTGPRAPAEAGSDFAESGARKFLTAPSGCKRRLSLPVSAARSPTELSRLKPPVVNRFRSLVYPKTAPPSMQTRWTGFRCLPNKKRRAAVANQPGVFKLF